MKHAVRAVTTPALAPGFRLAGLVVDEIDAGYTAEEIGEQIERAANRPHTGILLVEHALFARVPDVMRRKLEQRAVPILVPVPTAVFSSSATDSQDFVLELLRRAIGYRVRLQ